MIATLPGRSIDSALELLPYPLSPSPGLSLTILISFGGTVSFWMLKILSPVYFLETEGSFREVTKMLSITLSTHPFGTLSNSKSLSNPNFHHLSSHRKVTLWRVIFNTISTEK